MARTTTDPHFEGTDGWELRETLSERFEHSQHQKIFRAIIRSEHTLCPRFGPMVRGGISAMRATLGWGATVMYSGVTGEGPCTDAGLATGGMEIDHHLSDLLRKAAEGLSGLWPVCR